MIEVIAPSASAALAHFKIGNGFGGTLEQGGSHSYFYEPTEKVLYYLRVINDDDHVDMNDVLRIRDAGGLVYFSGRAIATHGHRWLEIGNCQ